MSAAFTLTFILSLSTAFAFYRGRAASAIVGARGELQTNLQGVVLEDLPYAYNSLEPFLGEQTLKIHHG